MSARVLVERAGLEAGTLVTLTLNRPDKLNAIDSPMLAALEQALGEIERDGEVRAVLLTGAGRAFSAGADIKEWTALPPLEFSRVWGGRGHALFDRLAGLRPPVLGAGRGTLQTILLRRRGLSNRADRDRTLGAHLSPRGPS